MQESTWVGICEYRSAAINALLLPFVLLHSVVLVIIAFAGDSLADSSVQLAVAAVLVIAATWQIFIADAVLVDAAALWKDMPDGLASSNLGAVMQKVPYGAMRVMGVVSTAIMVVVELLAIY